MLERKKKKDLLGLKDLSGQEIEEIISWAEKMKENSKRGVEEQFLKGKCIALLFTKPSTRTRVSFEVAISDLGGYPLFLSAQDLQLSRGETIEDTARVLSCYVDGLVIRTFAQEEIEEYARSGDIPVINALTDKFHPCQILADILTIKEKKGRLPGLKLVYLGDGNNVANSILIGMTKVGMDVTICCPPGYEPAEDVIALAQEIANRSGLTALISHNPGEAVQGADVLYTDVWASMGQERDQEERARIFGPFQINSRLISRAREDAIIMHCLPAHRGEEITDEIMSHPRCVIYDQAENRLHAQKAVLKFLYQ
ncbi:ornithine carbamoyltransferase [Candidatus Hakubella thermalkaliphila]|uniref:ornithine carbamoyltransferase n=1 Tax=Candidatus Hakubella thermalkaliphila TaxID=2754717 RepID=UPI001592BF7D